MNFYNVFYWLTVADGVKNVFDTFSNIFTWFTVISLIIVIIATIIGLDSDTSETGEKSATIWRKFFFKIYIFCQIICIITWLGYVLTPTKKDCLLIVAGGAVGNFITTDSSAKSIPSDITKFLHLSLNKEIEDLSKETSTDIKKELGVEIPKEQTHKEKILNNLKQMSKDEIISYLQKDSTTIQN
jgi:hypothetical protein